MLAVMRDKFKYYITEETKKNLNAQLLCNDYNKYAFKENGASLLVMGSLKINKKLIFPTVTNIQNDNIGFIGLGNMGNHMARNLMKKGESVVVYDVSKEATDSLAADGINLNEIDLFANLSISNFIANN